VPLLIYKPEVLELYWCSGMQMSKWAGCLVEWIYCFPFTGSNLELLAEPEERHHEEKIGFEQMIQVEIDGQVHIRSDPSCSYHSPEIRHDAVSST